MPPWFPGPLCPRRASYARLLPCRALARGGPCWACGLCSVETHRPLPSGAGLKCQCCASLGRLASPAGTEGAGLSGHGGLRLGGGLQQARCKCQGPGCSGALLVKGSLHRPARGKKRRLCLSPSPRSEGFLRKEHHLQIPRTSQYRLQCSARASFIIGIAYGGKGRGFEVGWSRVLSSAPLSSGVILGRFLPVRTPLPLLQRGCED